MATEEFVYCVTSCLWECGNSTWSASLSREQFKQFLSGKGIKIVHQNIRGVISNFHMLQEFVASYPEIDIIALTETHLTKTSWDSRYGLDGPQD